MPTQSRPEPSLVTAIVIAECRNLTERADAAAWMREIARVGEIIPLAEGLITAYAVRLHPDYLGLLHLIETSLRMDFPFGRVEYPFNETTLETVMMLATATDSRVIPVDSCELCARPEPFPADVFVLGEDGLRRRSGAVYCERCAREMAARQPRSVTVGEPERVAVAA